MMRRSFEDSSRPMIPKRDTKTTRTSTRYSTYSTATSDSTYTEKCNSICTEQPLVSGMTTNGNETRASNDLSKYKSGIDRMESKRLNDQRYVPSSEKELDMDKAAVLGRVQKALDRRYTGQDCEMQPRKPKKTTEKSG